MADECDVDNVTTLFDLAQAVFEDEPAADVVYVIAMLIAHGIKKSCTEKDPEATFSLLREAVAIELIAQV